MSLFYTINQSWVDLAKSETRKVEYHIEKRFDNVDIFNYGMLYTSTLPFMASYSDSAPVGYPEKGKRIFCKFSFADHYASEYEAVMYSYVKNLLETQRTPNIANFIESFTCPEFFARFMPLKKKGGGYYSKIDFLRSIFGHLYGDDFIELAGKKFELNRVIGEKSEISIQIQNQADKIDLILEMIEDERPLFGKNFLNNEKECLETLLEDSRKLRITLEMEKVAKYYELVEDMVDFSEELNSKAARFLVVEAVEGKPLSDTGLNPKDMVYDDLVDIFFQVFYTIRELRLNGVRHNDIHLRNIIITETKHKMIYFVDANSYYVSSSKYLVKLIDFDNSSFTNSELRNTFLDENCQYTGRCSFPSEAYDIFTFVCSFYSSFIDKNDFYGRPRDISQSRVLKRIRGFILSIIDEKLLESQKENGMINSTIMYNGTFYEKDAQGCILCVGVKESINSERLLDKICEPVDISDVPTFDMMIQKGIFKLETDLKDIRKYVNQEGSNLFVSSYSGKTYIDVRDLIIGVRGIPNDCTNVYPLANLGTTCYFNSIIQCIFQIKDLFDVVARYFSGLSILTEPVSPFAKSRTIVPIFESFLEQDLCQFSDAGEFYSKILEYCEMNVNRGARNVGFDILEDFITTVDDEFEGRYTQKVCLVDPQGTFRSVSEAVNASIVDAKSLIAVRLSRHPDNMIKVDDRIIFSGKTYNLRCAVAGRDRYHSVAILKCNNKWFEVNDDKILSCPDPIQQLEKDGTLLFYVWN